MPGQQNVDLKVVLLGDSSVGKTCLLVRFLNNSFGNTAATIGASFAVKNVIKDGEQYTLGLWDTAGQERYNSLSSFYCRGAGCAIICFDICKRQTFENVESWVDKLRSSSPDKGCFIVLVGAKLDMVLDEGVQREVTEQQARDFAKRIGADVYFDTSAKSGHNVNAVFEHIVGKLHKPDGRANQSTGAVNLNQSNAGQQSKRGCCG